MLDPLVDVFVSRDLDSAILDREVSESSASDSRVLRVFVTTGDVWMMGQLQKIQKNWLWSPNCGYCMLLPNSKFKFGAKKWGFGYLGHQRPRFLGNKKSCLGPSFRVFSIFLG